MGECMRAGWRRANAILSVRHIWMNVNRERRKANKNMVKTMDNIGQGKITLVIEIQTLEKDKASALANTQTIINNSYLCTLQVFTHDKGKSNCKIWKKHSFISTLTLKMTFSVITLLRDWIFLKTGLLQPCSTNIQGRAQQHFSPSSALFCFVKGLWWAPRENSEKAACDERSAWCDKKCHCWHCVSLEWGRLSPGLTDSLLLWVMLNQVELGT